MQQKASSVTTLHNLQHINHKFQPVSNRFEIPSNYQSLTLSNGNDYAQSIQMFFILTLTISVVILLIKFLLATIYSCKTNNYAATHTRTELDRDPCIFRCRICLLLFSAVGAIGALIFGVGLGTSMVSIAKDLTGFVDAAANSTLELSSATANILSNMTYDLQQLNATNTQVYTTVSDLQAQLPANATNNIAQAQIWTSIENAILTGGKFLQQAVTGVVIAAIVFGLLGWLLALIDELCCRRENACCGCQNRLCSFLCSLSRLIFEVVFLAMSLLLVVLASFLFAGSVAVADVCVDFDPLVAGGVNSVTGNSFSPVVQYYVYCDPAQNGNPFVAIENAVSQIGSFGTQINQQVNSTLAQYPSPSAPEHQLALGLKSAYDGFVVNIVALFQAVACSNFQPPYQSTKKTLCFDSMTNLFGFYFMLGAFVFLLNVRECTACCYYKVKTLKQNNQRAEPYVALV